MFVFKTNVNSKVNTLVSEQKCILVLCILGVASHKADCKYCLFKLLYKIALIWLKIFYVMYTSMSYFKCYFIVLIYFFKQWKFVKNKKLRKFFFEQVFPNI